MKRQEILRLTPKQLEKMSVEQLDQVDQDWDENNPKVRTQRERERRIEAVRAKRLPIAQEELAAVELEITELNSEEEQIVAEQKLVRLGEGNINPKELKAWQAKYYAKVQPVVTRQRKLEIELADLKGLPAPNVWDYEAETKKFNAQTAQEDTEKAAKLQKEKEKRLGSYKSFSKEKEAKKQEQEQDDQDDEIMI